MDKNKIREALEIGLNYVINDGWTRHQKQEEQEIRDALAELDTDDWIKVTPETMPKDGQRVLVLLGDGSIDIDTYGSNYALELWNVYLNSAVKAWQPLPSSPKE